MKNIILQILRPKELKALLYIRSGLIIWLAICLVLEVIAQLIGGLGNGSYTGPFTNARCVEIFSDFPMFETSDLGPVCTTTSDPFLSFIVQMGIGMLIGLVVYVIKSSQANKSDLKK